MEKLPSLNFYGIFSESLTIIFSWKKIFFQITIATIFPLSLLSLCHAQISHDLLFEINLFSSCLFKIVYVFFFLALSLLSTSAVVHAVARVYTAGEVCFGEAMSAVPRVWKRLVVTFAWSLMIVVAYNTAASSLLFPWLTARTSVSGPVFVMYAVGFVYASIVWHLASVVSVLEEECGAGAMIRGKALVRGKMVISLGVFALLNSCFVLIQAVFERFVVGGECFWSRIGWGIVCFLLLSGFTLLGLVTQTIVYFVCKLYHCHEMMEESCLPNVHHHKVCLGDYAPLGSNQC